MPPNHLGGLLLVEKAAENITKEVINVEPAAQQKLELVYVAHFYHTNTKLI
jgi:hypothetical protein